MEPFHSILEEMFREEAQERGRFDTQARNALTQ